MIEAAAAQRVGQLAGAVRGQHHMRYRGRRNRSELRDRDLKIRQQFEQERLELVVGTVDLVDQQHRRRGPPDRGQQRPFQQIFFRKNLVLDGVGILAAMRLDREQLPLVIPFIERGRLIQALIALQADQLGRMRRGQRFCHFGLADARFTFEQQRTPEQLHQRDRGRQFAVGDIAACRQGLRNLLASFHCQCIFQRACSAIKGIFSPPPAKRRGGGGGGGGPANTPPEEQAETPPHPPPPPAPRQSRGRGGGKSPRR